MPYFAMKCVTQDAAECARVKRARLQARSSWSFRLIITTTLQILWKQTRAMQLEGEIAGQYQRQMAKIGVTLEKIAGYPLIPSDIVLPNCSFDS